jgi:hypothetical protein
MLNEGESRGESSMIDTTMKLEQALIYQLKLFALEAY